MRVDGDGNEWWSARDIAKALGYADWRNFERCAWQGWMAIEKLEGSVRAGQHIHVEDNTYEAGFGTKKIRDYRLTRLGAYMALGYSSKPFKRALDTPIDLEVCYRTVTVIGNKTSPTGVVYAVAFTLAAWHVTAHRFKRSPLACSRLSC